MALTWDVRENVNAYREISREEYEQSDRSIFALPRYEHTESG